MRQEQIDGSKGFLWGSFYFISYFSIPFIADALMGHGYEAIGQGVFAVWLVSLFAALVAILSQLG